MGSEQETRGHTPGPWHVSWPDEDSALAMVEGALILGPENQPVAEILSVDVDETARFASHDAALIAAAPGMRDALYAIAALPCDYTSPEVFERRVRETVAAAIAKVEAVSHD